MNIIGKMTRSRGGWGSIKPITKIKKSDKVYNRKRAKKEMRRND